MHLLPSSRRHVLFVALVSAITAPSPSPSPSIDYCPERLTISPKQRVEPRGAVARRRRRRGGGGGGGRWSGGIAAAAAEVHAGGCSSLSSSRELTRNGGDMDPSFVDPPYVRPRRLVDGKVVYGDDDEAEPVETYGCCSILLPSCSSDHDGGGTGTGTETNAPGESSNQRVLRPTPLGRVPQMSASASLSVLQRASNAWDGGYGAWPQMSLAERVRRIEHFLDEIRSERDAIVKVLMWEIAKNKNDAESEFDRTVAFVRQVIDVIRSPTETEYNNNWITIGSTNAFVRRGPLGIVLCLGPFNYPLNETYATLIPALLMGNIVVMKIPTVGGLVHMLTMEAFAKTLPPNTINFISGSGRTTMPPLMETGKIDCLAFIGGSKAADDLIRKHPEPHRLKTFLQLEAKNMGVFLPDLFQEYSSSNSNDNIDDNDNSDNDKDIRRDDKIGMNGNIIKKGIVLRSIDEAILGSLSFNGQRCTALKILFVPAPHANRVADAIAARVDELNVGLPWQRFDPVLDDDDDDDDDDNDNVDEIEFDGETNGGSGKRGEGPGGGGKIKRRRTTSQKEDNTGKPKYSDITPLPNQSRVRYMKRLINDATSKGARIVNRNGGTIVGGESSTLMVPAVLFPVTADMDIYREEQFGPIVPIVPYDALDDVLEYGRVGKYAQQVSLFTHGGGGEGGGRAVHNLVDYFSSIFGKININSQCGRSPDVLPFSGRRSSAMGVMSVTESLREFSIPTVISYKKDNDDDDTNDRVAGEIRSYSKFTASL